MNFIDKIRNRLLAFIAAEKDVPLLAGLSVGLYWLTFYYSKNFALADSPQQILFFTAYYLLLPVAAIYTVYLLLGIFGLQRYGKNWLFVGISGFFLYYMSQMNGLLYPAAWILVAAILSIWLKRYYKLAILLLFFITIFNLKPIAGIAYRSAIASNNWKKLPDGIESVKFSKHPNVYYIQPDGYTSFSNLKSNPHYRMDVASYHAFLEAHGFTVYDDYRSNYCTTLLSNAATFSMRHHYAQADVAKHSARNIIMGGNPVLRIFKSNGYRTNFITESPYLIMNRPALGYDYTNFPYSEMPFFGDGFESGYGKDVLADLKLRMKTTGKTGNFFFIEKFLPCHITGSPTKSRGPEKERENYRINLKHANQWLEETVAYITANDPDGIVIIGGDHGGYVGFSYTGEAATQTKDPDLIKSMFGAQLAIKWNDSGATQYDTQLKTGINLFRTLFSYLASEKKYLDHREENGSYMQLNSPSGLYRYIDDDGNVVFEKK